MHADVCFYTLQGKCQSGSSIGFQYNDITCHNYVIVQHWQMIWPWIVSHDALVVCSEMYLKQQDCTWHNGFIYKDDL